MFSSLINYIRSTLRTLLTSPARWMSGAGRLAGLSLPVRVMLILFVFILLLIVGYYTILWIRPEREYFMSRFSLRVLGPLVLLWIALPVTAYFATKFWLETPPSQFPDIDESWKLGIHALARAGIDISEVPLYFTIGVADALTADQVMQASNWELLVDGTPDGAHPLRWYASKNAVMLFLLNASATSKIHSGHGENEEMPINGDLRGTIVSGGTIQSRPNMGIHGTIVANDSTGFDSPQSVPMTLRGTMIAGSTPSSPSSSAATPRAPQLDRQERILQTQRLERVCELAVGARISLCPLNGVLGVVDWNVLLASRDGQLATALRTDYDAVVNGSQLYVPMILMINGLDIDAGFVELVRRVGEDRAKSNRFGQGFSHLIPPDQPQMVALAAHASGAFEDWIYDLFKHPECLGRSNNEKLFGLLCKTRNELNPRLTEMLAGLASDGKSGRNAMLAGCYFGATGKNHARQAFVRSVIEKLVSLEDDIEWTETALANENRLQASLRLIVFCNAMLILYIISVIGYKFIFGGGN